MNASLAEVAAQVRSGRRFLVTGHARLDGDALGSMLALAQGLEALHKEVVLYDADLPPERLRWLPGADRVTTARPSEPFDATFVLDCGDPRLLGGKFPARAVTGPLVVLDHHASVREFGDLVVRDPQAAAVGILVARLLSELAVPLSRPIAEALWCSLVSDTGWFRYSSTNLETLELATACVRAGCEPWTFARQSEEEEPVGRLRLLRRVLETLELHGGDRIALLTLNHALLREAGATVELADGFVNYARAIRGVEVGALLTDAGSMMRASLRSKGGVDVGQVAARFGGGGHRAAAGCSIAAPFNEARQQLLRALEEALA